MIQKFISCVELEIQRNPVWLIIMYCDSTRCQSCSILDVYVTPRLIQSMFDLYVKLENVQPQSHQ